LESALGQLPQSARLRRQLIDLHIKHDRRQDAFAQLDQLPDVGPKREALRSAVRGACLAAKMNWPAAVGYLRAAHAAGCRDVLCLRWLSVTLISLANLPEARGIVAEWAAIEPGNPEVQQYVRLCGPSGGAELIDLSGEEGGSQHLRLDGSSVERSAPRPNFSQPGQRTSTSPYRR
jgi:hypothetical protein